LRGAPPTSPQLIDPPPQVPIQARLGLLLGSRLLVRYPLPHRGQSEPSSASNAAVRPNAAISSCAASPRICWPADSVDISGAQPKASQSSPRPGPATSCTVAGRSARVLDGADDLGREFGVGQKLLDECGENLLASYAGDSEAVGRCSLPDVEGSVCGGWEVDGASRSLGA
jgi:hypothetical protein